MQTVTTIFTCGMLRLMGNFQQAGIALWRPCKVGCWSQAFSFSVTWPSWASCARAEALSLSVLQKRIGEMRHQQSILKMQCSFPCHHSNTTVDARAKVGHVLERTVSGLLHPEVVLALELLEQFPAVHTGAESLFYFSFVSLPICPVDFCTLGT